MDKIQLSALLTISSQCNKRTLAYFHKQFNEKRFGVTTTQFLFINGYIEVEPTHKKYCRVTEFGNKVIDSLVAMTELLSHKYI